jgi:hypothetical protein
VLREQLGDDGRALLTTFPPSVDCFRQTLAKRSVMVYPGVSEVGKGQALQLAHRVIRVKAARADLVEQFSEGELIHCRPILPAR